MIEYIRENFQKIIEIGDGICCVCHHHLDIHIDEEDIWRCHALGTDGSQCECALRKNRADGDISYYDLAKRSRQRLEDLEKELKQFTDIKKKIEK